MGIMLYMFSLFFYSDMKGEMVSFIEVNSDMKEKMFVERKAWYQVLVLPAV